MDKIWARRAKKLVLYGAAFWLGRQEGKSRIKKLDNIVVELEDCRRFVKADNAMIASNTGFKTKV